MGIPVHTVDQINGSQFNRQDRVMMGLLSGVASPASATSASVLGAITPGTGFTNINTVTLAPTGGTGSGLTAIPTSLKAVSVSAVATPGTGYAINDTITIAGGTLQPGGPGAASVLTVATTQLVGLATMQAAPGACIHTSRVIPSPWPAVPSATAAIVTVDSVTTAGGVIHTFHITDRRRVHRQPHHLYSSRASHPAAGTGATFKTAVWGVQAATISTAGAYAVAPTNAAAQASTSGSGTGVTFTMAYGLGSAQITASGNYSAAPSMTVTDSAAGTGASIATVTLGGNGNPIFVPIAFDLPATYCVQVEPSMNCTTYVPYASKTNLGFSVALNPPTAATTLAAGTFDLVVIA